LYGDGNVPLTAEGIQQAYRDVLGRELGGVDGTADKGALDHWLTQGPKAPPKSDLLRGLEGGYSVGTGSLDWSDPLGGFGALGSDDRKRRAVTFNEFVDRVLKNGKEYKERVASGELPAWTQERRDAIFNPQPEAPAAGDPGGGGNAAAQGDDRYGGFYASPGYQFRMDESNKAVDRNSAARGRYQSGARDKALTRYSQGVASDEFNNYMNRLAAASGLGQTATAQTGQFGMNAAANAGNAVMARGNAQAAGQMGMANTLNNAANNYMQYQQWTGNPNQGRQISDVEKMYGGGYYG
jgi:hypothetical protein